MKVSLLGDVSEASTSAVGSVYRAARDAAPAAFLIATTFPVHATANTYVQGSMATWTTIAPCAESTAFGPIGQIHALSTESVAEAILEIRRRSGLTWEELSELFEVSRRSVHHWANGKPVSARNDRMIRRMLAAIRQIDRGSQEHTRAVLMRVDEGMGLSVFELLRNGRIDEALGSVEEVKALDLQRTPHSRTARYVYRPQPQMLLLEAEQDRPFVPSNARIVHPKRVPKTAG